MTQILQILTSNGYGLSEVLDDTPLWLCRILVQGLGYRDIHLRSEQRIQRLLIAQPWSRDELQLEDLGTFPWEEQEEQEIEPIDVDKMKAQDSAVIEEIRQTLQ